MALKDWKKIVDGKSEIKFFKLHKVLGKLMPDAMSGAISIYAPNYNRSYWRVLTSANAYSGIEDFKDFSVKSQALKFAKEYMRTH